MFQRFHPHTSIISASTVYVIKVGLGAQENDFILRTTGRRKAAHLACYIIESVAFVHVASIAFPPRCMFAQIEPSV